MIKYWKPFILLTLIVISIGVFYISSAFATSDYPVYTIEKVSGDEKVMESVVIYGDYNDDYRNINVTLSLEGMEYIDNQSFFKQMTGSQLEPQIKKMQKDYWNFTRGKVTSSVNYFDSDQYLAYSNMAYDRSFADDNNNYTFQIAVLNKETNKTVSFDMKVPNANEFAFVNTASVQMVGDELKVITQNESGDYTNSDYYLYTFDLANKKLKSGEVLLSKSRENDSDLYLLDEMNSEHTRDYVHFYEAITEDLSEETDEVDYEDSEVSNEDKIINIKLHTYNLNTGELKTEELPESLYDTDYPNLYDGENIYFKEWTDQSTKIIKYNINTKKMETITESDFNFDIMSSNDNNLYLISFKEKSDLIKVIDLASGQLVYEGNIILKNDGNIKEDMHSFQIYNIDFK